MKQLRILPLLAFAAALSFSGCSANSPFEAKSDHTAGDGKIPVQGTVSATASGNTVTGQPTDYTVGGGVTFGKAKRRPSPK